MPENSEGDAASNAKDQPGLVRQLGLFDSTMIVVGIVVGAGIFISTGLMAQVLPSPGLILVAWIVGGFLTLAGALTYAELGAAMPAAGGQYVFIREAYGRLLAFLFGWIFFLAYLCGVIAYMSLTFAEYLSYFLPALSTSNAIVSIGEGARFSLTITMGHVVALALIVVLSSVNYFGVKFGKSVQNVFTVVKIGFILIFIVWGLTVGDKPALDLSMNPGGLPVGQLLVGFGLAMLSASIAFGGWDSLTFVGSEIKNPVRNISLALLIGTLIITALYVLINLVYLRALTVDEMAGSVKIAEDSTSALRGGGVAGLVSALVLISIFGGLNGVILAGPRIYYAMARDGVFFRQAAIVHSVYRTPSFAIWIQAAWASVLLLTGTVYQLIVFVTFIGTIFWILTASSLFILRRKLPDLQRPYKVWGYPYVPIIFIVSSACIMVNALINQPRESLTGLALLALGVPVYFIWLRRTKESATDES